MGRPDILKIHFEFSSKLGVRDLPKLAGNHQSNVRGLYVVGDLADAPIIKVALNQVVDHTWNIIRVILQVTVQGGDQVTAGFIDARLHGCGLAEVTAQFDHTDMAAVVVGFALQGLRRAVSRAVVDDQ